MYLSIAMATIVYKQCYDKLSLYLYGQFLENHFTIDSCDLFIYVLKQYSVLSVIKSMYYGKRVRPSGDKSYTNFSWKVCETSAADRETIEKTTL